MHCHRHIGRAPRVYHDVVVHAFLKTFTGHAQAVGAGSEVREHISAIFIRRGADDRLAGQIFQCQFGARNYGTRRIRNGSGDFAGDNDLRNGCNRRQHEHEEQNRKCSARRCCSHQGPP